MKGKGSGWKGESRRHSLARKGVKTVLPDGRRFDVSKFVAKGDFKPKSLQDLASYYYKFFTTNERPNGDKIVVLKDDAPEELKELVRDAHGDMLPDDYKYRFIEDALGNFADYDDPDSAIDEMESDVYTSDLTEWLNSSNNRVYYLSDALSEYGVNDGFQALSLAQLQEKREVAWAVKDSLETIMGEYE